VALSVGFTTLEFSPAIRRGLAHIRAGAHVAQLSTAFGTLEVRIARDVRTVYDHTSPSVVDLLRRRTRLAQRTLQAHACPQKNIRGIRTLSPTSQQNKKKVLTVKTKFFLLINKIYQTYQEKKYRALVKINKSSALNKLTPLPF
jgi:hypothetical protein